MWTGSGQLEDLEEMALFWIRRAFRCPDPTALFWIHPSFKRPEPVFIMRRSFETIKFLILRFFIGWPTGCPWATCGLPVAPKAQVLFTPYNFFNILSLVILQITFENVCWISIRNVNSIKMRKRMMFITAVSVLFLIKLYDGPRTKVYKKRISVGQKHDH